MSYSRETESDASMKKVANDGHVLGFSVLEVGAL